MSEPEIHQRLGKLTAQMKSAQKAARAADHNQRAADDRIAALHGALAEITRRLDAQDRALDSIERSLSFLRGGWKGAALVGAVLVGAGGVLAQILGALGLGHGGWLPGGQR